MKKLLIGAAVAVPVIWAGATWGISNKTESVFDDIITKSNEDLSNKFPFVVIEKQAYTKGFTSSTAQSVMKVNSEYFGDSDKGKDFSVTFNHTVFHGPVMKTPYGLTTGSSYVYTTIDQTALPVEVSSILKVLFDDKEPLISGMKTGLGGGVSVDFEVSPISLNQSKISSLKASELDIDPEQLEHFSFTGITGHLKTDKVSSYAKGDVKFGALELKGKDGGEMLTLKLKESIMKLDVSEFYNGTALDGTVDMEIPEFSVAKGDNEGVTITGVTIHTDTTNQGGSNLSGKFTLGVDKLLLNIPDAPFKLPVSAINLAGEVNSLDTAAVKKAIDLGSELQKTQFAMFKNDFSEESFEEMANKSMAYVNAIGEMVKQGTELKYQIDINNETGESQLKLDLNYAEAKKLFDLKTVKELVTALSGQLNISIGKGMISGTPLEEAIGMPVAMGFAVDKEKSYELVADLSSGELKVNGEPMPVLDMVGDQPLPWEELKDSFK